MLITLYGRPMRRRPNTTGSRTAPKPFVSDSQWVLIEPHLRNPPPNPKGGRPRVDPRPCLEGILWMLKSGARWQDLPERYPSPATCWRRLQQWTQSGVWVIVWQILIQLLDGLGQIDWEEAIGDGTFAPGKKGVKTLASPRRAKAAS